MAKVYLAGKITGGTFNDATEWREYATYVLKQSNIVCLSPLRGKEFLKDSGILHSGTYDNTIASQRGIMRRDFRDCTTSDCILMNLLGTTKPSIGTIMEAAWAYQAGIPVVLVMEPDNIHSHVMFSDVPMYQVTDLDQGIALVRMVLNET